ncbi:hypothetical protein AGMMS49944_21650 [Spirochaetia bacterium]|nr:hypothetical protein AGMMS49944_21650 [Spirochaetia bacterium]
MGKGGLEDLVVAEIDDIIGVGKIDFGHCMFLRNEEAAGVFFALVRYRENGVENSERID